MKYLVYSIKRNLAAYICIAAAGVCFAAVFALYSLPIEAALYGAALALFFLLIVTVICAVSDHKKHTSLVRAMDSAENGELVLPVPSDVIERDYWRLAQLLSGENLRLKNDAAEKYSSLYEYYTVWAHQMKTPIAAMRLRLQSEDSPLSRDISAELGRIESYTDAAMCMIRLDSGSGDYAFRECEIDTLVRQAVRKFSVWFITKKLRLDYKGTDMKVVTDEKWLSFVIEQILSNALKYTPEGGCISIYTEDGCILISDTGIGIDPADLPRIFENGFTGDNGRFDKRASGIGLYLCGRICRNLGHKITAVSEKGKGTTVKIALLTKM